MKPVTLTGSLMCGQCFPVNKGKSLNAQSHLAGRAVPQLTQRAKAVAIAPGCPPELNGATPLLRTTHCGGKTDRQAGTDLETPSLLAAFTDNATRCYVDHGEEKLPMVLPSATVRVPQSRPKGGAHWYFSGTAALEVTTVF